MTNKFVYSFYLMLFSPVLSLMIGLKERSYAFKRALLILFITIFGSTINFAEGNDGYSHLEKVVEHYVDLGFVNFMEELYAILIFAPQFGTNDDVYIHVLSYFVGAILGMPELFFVFVSFIYAYFFSSAVLKVLRVVPQTTLSFTFYAFAVIFILTKSLEGINTVRTWTGLWVLFYAVFSYIETKKVKYLFLMFVPPFIHIAYFIMAIPAWFVVFFGTRFKWVYTGIFVISFFFGINQNSVIDNLSQTEVGESKVQGYYVEDGGEAKSAKFEDSTWYRKMQKGGVQKYALYIIAFTLIIGGVYFHSMTNLESTLFSIGILTLALSNFSGFIFALGARSSLIGTIFILATLILLLKRGFLNSQYNRRHSIYNIIFIVSIFMYVPYVIYKIADLIYFFSFFMLAFPFIPWISQDLNFSVRDFLGYIF